MDGDQLRALLSKMITLLRRSKIFSSSDLDVLDLDGFSSLSEICLRNSQLSAVSFRFGYISIELSPLSDSLLLEIRKPGSSYSLLGKVEYGQKKIYDLRKHIELKDGSELRAKS